MRFIENIMLIEKEQGCTFCNPESVKRPHFNDYGKDRLDLVHFVETDNVLVIPDLLPVGIHLLMIIKRHNYSFAAHPELVKEVGSALHQTEQITRTPIVFIEHGGIADGGSNQSIYHQHAHLFGANGFDLVRFMSNVLNDKQIFYQQFFTPDPSPITNLGQVYQNKAYLYLQQGHRGIIAHDPDNSFPSQLAQRNIGWLFENRELDWKQIPHNPELARLSVQKIIELIERCKL